MINPLELLAHLVARPSISPRDEGCQSILKTYLRAWGWAVESIDCRDANNFWAIWPDQTKTRLVFAGHTDVVSPGLIEAWETNPFELIHRGEYLLGRGVADMKGALVAFFVAFERFLSAYPEKAKSIGFLITSAEEGPSELGTPVVLESLAQKGVEFEACLVGEPTSEKYLGDVFKHGRRGSLSGELIFLGKQGHIAYPHLANNPIHGAIPAINKLLQQSWDRPHSAFPPTQFQCSNIQAGQGEGNVIPGSLRLNCNFRYTPNTTPEHLIHQVEKVLSCANIRYEAKWNHYGPPYYTNLNHHLVQSIQRAIQEVTGTLPKPSTSGGTSDGRYIAQTGAQVIEFGLLNRSIHQVNESIPYCDLFNLVEIYYQFLCVFSTTE